jgi:cystathionine beta-lyase
LEIAMARRSGLDRRTFLRGTGAGALLSAAGVRPAGALDLSRGSFGSAWPLYDEVYDFDEPFDRRGTDCTKWDGAEQDMGHPIEVGMGIADTDFRAAPCITKAVAERCAHENWGYLRRPAKYSEAVAEWNQRRYGLEIDPGDLVWTTGVHPALIAALQTFSPPGSRVLLTTPVYSGFYTDLRFTRTVAEESSMVLVDGRYEIDWDDFELRAARSNTFILCNPQNPTGNCWSQEELLRMGEICLRHNTIVLSDEIHCDFVNEGQTYTPFAALPDRDIVNNSLTFKAASKSFNLAAMKVSWYFSTNPDLLARARTNSRADLPTLGLVANHAALTEGEPWLDQLRTYVNANHDFAEAYIRDNVPHVGYKKAEGTYLAWIDVQAIAEGIDAVGTAAKESAESVNPVAPEDIVQRWVAKNAGVFLGQGDNYGPGGEGRMRMNLGTQRTRIKLALDNIAEATTQL